MAKIISIHSFRGGTGKSNISANIATLMALEGLRVGIVDTDVQSPGIHILFGLSGHTITSSLNDYLWGQCHIQDAAVDVTSNLGTIVPGYIYLIPSSIKAGDIARVLRDGCDPHVLTSGFHKLIKELDLDVLIIDTHPGLNEEVMLSIALSNTLIIIMRTDQQDYEGTSVTVELAQALEVPNMLIIVNKAPAIFELADVKAKVEQQFKCHVAAVIPHADEMMVLSSAGIFVLHYPNHSVTQDLKQVTQRLMG